MIDYCAGYNALALQLRVEHLECMVHARRKFVDIQKVQPKGMTGRTDVTMDLINMLCGIECGLKSVGDEQRFIGRQEERADLGSAKKLAGQNLIAGGTQSVLGHAVNYLASNWSQLECYIEADNLSIDNSAAERAIKPFVIGRRAWLCRVLE
ncbi:hypothetical protein PSCICN_10170 [Pseudomonas cichorii]|nr:hypothetical protein PSCICN_10170 [Pseudomonas cichorii]